MSYKNIGVAGMGLLLLAVVLRTACNRDKEKQQQRATPSEVVAKVLKAAALLEAQGEKGLAILRDSNSEFSWKDTYVFVLDCDADSILAIPAFPELQQAKVSQRIDDKGTPYGRALCLKAAQWGGGWVAYRRPRPGESNPSRKISYIISVAGLPYQVGAGVYDDTISIAELEEITAGLD